MADEIIHGLIQRQVEAAVEQMRDEVKQAVATERERCANIEKQWYEAAVLYLHEGSTSKLHELVVAYKTAKGE